MTPKSLQSQIALGEDSKRQFKVDVRNAESLAAEMAAFANSERGQVFLGVADDGSTPGLAAADVSRINQLISNAASQLVRSPLTVQTENVALGKGHVVIVFTVPKGIDKPYFDKNGVIWLKTSADKWRNSKEELRWLLQFSDQFHADELPTKAGLDKLDKLRFRDFLRDVYKRDLPDAEDERLQLLQNMNLATDDGFLNLAGVLMFAERPEWIKPQLVVKAIRYPGNAIHVSDYLDTEDFEGPLQKIFADALGFIMRNLHKVQAGRGVNAPGQPEIPESVFEELLVNALVHRDYLVNAPIRLFIFDNRIEIISPGHLPKNLTVEKIRNGNSNIRNPILVSYVAKGLLPYHGLGSGIKRALEQWPQIEFSDDYDGCLFRVAVNRNPVEDLDLAEADALGNAKNAPETASLKGQSGHLSGQDDPIADLLNKIQESPNADYASLARDLRVSEATVKRNIQKLKQQNRIRRAGSKKQAIGKSSNEQIMNRQALLETLSPLRDPQPHLRAGPPHHGHRERQRSSGLRRPLVHSKGAKLKPRFFQFFSLERLGNEEAKMCKKNNQATFKEQLSALKDKRIVFIFDECHRSQFGENHKAIKEFFPKAQLFGFTGTPIFEANASFQKIKDTQASMRTTEDLFQKQLHAYTITHAIDDGNVLRFHIDYFKPKEENDKKPSKPGEAIAKRAVIEAILTKHDTSTAHRRFNAILATSSINDAIEYHGLLKTMQADKQAADPEFKPLNIACVFSPPADGDPDVKQIQEDLPQELADNEEDPEGKKAALKSIIADYNARYGTNHRISDFDLYYQDVQKRIKDQQWPNSDFPAAQKIDITIVVDMLLTGFDSKFLNTLYVDKNLKHHGLIQAFSRTNRVLNGTKPYGNILDFRQQQDAVDAAIALFSGEKSGEQAREIWLVEKAPVVIQKLDAAVQQLDTFMKSQGLDCTPSAAANLKGDAAKAAFCTQFKEVQRLKTQLDQYTDLTEEIKASIEQVLPEENLRGFKGQYLETAKRLKEQQGKGGDKPGSDDPVDQIDFEFVLFASAVIDYDYIMGLIAKFSEKGPGKSKMTREELIGLISADAKFMNERDDIAEYIGTLKAGEGLSETAIRDGYTRFKAEKNAKELAAIAARHSLTTAALQTFVDGILDRMIFDGEQLGDLMAPLDLGWKARTQAELALMSDLHPLLTQRAGGRDISGLSAYEQ